MYGRNIDSIKYFFITINKHKYEKLNECQILHATKLRELNVVENITHYNFFGQVLVDGTKNASAISSIGSKSHHDSHPQSNHYIHSGYIHLALLLLLLEPSSLFNSCSWTATLSLYSACSFPSFQFLIRTHLTWYI
jgi:hypothetical protein